MVSHIYDRHRPEALGKTLDNSIINHQNLVAHTNMLALRKSQTLSSAVNVGNLENQQKHCETLLA